MKISSILFSTFCFFLLLISQQTNAATCTWTNGGGTGNWNNAANWSCGVVPDGDDDVSITSGVVTLDIVTTVQSLTITNGSDLILNANLTISGNVTISNSVGNTISGSGNLSIDGNLSWNGGTISGSGTLSLAGTLSSTGVGLYTLTLNGRNLSLTSGGTLNGPTFNLSGGAALTLPVSKTLTIQGSTSITGNLATATSFINHGTIEIAASSALTVSSNQFTNDGTINIGGASMSISGAAGSTSTHSGAVITIAAGANLMVNATALHSFTNCSISGAGEFRVVGNATVIVNINTGTTITNPVVMNGGELVLNTAQTFPSLNKTGNDKLTLNANLTVTGNLTTGSSAGQTITGAGNLDIGGNLSWNGGTISGSGTLSLAGTLSSTGVGLYAFTLNGRNLSLTSGGTLNGPTFNLSGGAALTLPVSKTLTIQGSTSIAGNLATATSFINHGTIETAASSALTVSSNQFTNDGTINIGGASMNISGAAGSTSTHSGAVITIAAGANLTVNATALHSFTNCSISGAGEFRVVGNATVIVNINTGTTITNPVLVSGGELVLNTAQTILSLSMTGGDLTLNANLTVSGDMSLTSTGSQVGGAGGLTVNGNLTWSNGTIGGNGTFSLTGTLTSSNGTATLDTRSLSLSSGGTWTNQSFNLNNGAALTIPSGKTLTISQASSETITSNTTGSLTIIGMLIKNSAQMLTLLGIAVTNSGTFNINAGTVRFSTSTSSTHSGAAISIASGAIFEMGTSGTGTHTFTNTSISGAGIFKLTASGYTVNFNSGATVSVPIEQTNGIINVNSAQTIPSLSESNGTINLNANLTISGNLTKGGGTITGPGNLTVNGNLDWTGGTISGSGAFNLAGTFTSTNVGVIFDTRSLSLTSGGTLNNSVNIDLNNGAVLTIPSGQTLTINDGINTGIINSATANGLLVINGTLSVSITSYYQIQNVNVDNNNTINITGGRLEVRSNTSTHDAATISIGTGAELEFSGGNNATYTHTFTNSTVSGAGLFDLASNELTVYLNGTTTVSSPVSVRGGGNLVLNAAQTVPAVNNEGGLITLNANLTVTGDLTMTETNTGFSEIDGTGNLTINGNLIWEEGNIKGTGTFTIGGTLTINISVCRLYTRTLSLTSGGVFNGDGSENFYLYTGARLIIPAGQTLSISNNSSMPIDGDETGELINNGTITKTGSATLTLQNLLFTNNSILNVNTGTMTIGDDATSTHTAATVNLASGGILNFTLNTSTFTNTAINGPGTLKVSGGTVTINSTTSASNLNLNIIAGGTLNINVSITFQSLTQSGGTIAGTGGTITITGAMTWTGGIIAPTAASTISVGGSFSMNGNTTTLSNTSLTFDGGGTWTNISPTMQNNAAFIVPTGKTLTFNYTSVTYNLLNGTGGGGTLTNNGTIVKTGSGFLSIKVPYTANTGSTTDIQGGTFDFDNTFANTGTVKGTATINLANATVSAYGTFSPGSSPGTLTVTGNYTNSILDIEIVAGSPVLYDQLIVTGTATLGGTLNVTETSTVPTGSWVILTAASITGTFSTVNLPDCFSLSYTSTTVTLQKALVKIWDGSTNSWSSATNWIPNGVPCLLDDVVISGGVCILDIPPDADSIAINGGELRKIGAATYSTSAPITIGPSGTLNIFEGTLDINGNFTNDGRVEGFGTIDIENATIIGGYGTYAPGNSAGTLKVKGTYCNEILESEIGGTGIAVEHDLLDVTQTIVAEGTLNVLYLGGTVPPGTRTILQCPTAGCLTGTFATVTFPPECQGGCSIIYTSKEVKLVNTLPIEFIGTCTWLGGTGNWSDKVNWSCNTVPNANDTVVINSGQVMLTSPVSVSSLMASGGSMSGSGNLTVTGLLKKTGTGTFGVNVPFQLPTGFINAASGILDFNSQFTYGGTVGGNGTIDLSGAIVQALPGGNFSPGASPGTLSILGNYANQILNMEISESGGIISKDLLAVNGAVNLSGSVLNILPAGTMPAGTHQILTFGSNPGNTQFATVNFSPFCGNCSLVYAANSITLSNTQVCIPNLTIENMTVPGGTYRSLGGLISNLATIVTGSPVIFKSDTGVLLGQNFTVPLGGIFEIGIEACPSNANEVLPGGKAQGKE